VNSLYTCHKIILGHLLLDVPSPTLHQTSGTACLQSFCCAIVNLVLNDTCFYSAWLTLSSGPL